MHLVDANLVDAKKTSETIASIRTSDPSWCCEQRCHNSIVAIAFSEGSDTILQECDLLEVCQSQDISCVPFVYAGPSGSIASRTTTQPCILQTNESAALR
jgi:hypothetical protein